MRFFQKIFFKSQIFSKKNLDILFSITYIFIDALDEMKEIAFRSTPIF
jgi:hypothetical protein